MNLQYLHRPSTQKEGKKQLMILLHGYGSNKEDLFSFATDLPGNLEVFSLQAPRKLPFGGFAWYDINFENAQKFNNTKQAQESIQLLLQDIAEICENHNCDSTNIILCGFSQGAILSYAMALHYPKLFSKILCLSGYPAEDIVGKIDKSNDFSQLSFYISHGNEDVVIPIEWARQAKKLLSDLNIQHSFNEYYQGHGINAENYRDMMLFLIKS